MKYIIFLTLFISLFSLSITLFIAREFTIFKNSSTIDAPDLNTTKKINQSESGTLTSQEMTDTCGTVCQSQIDQKVEERIATLSGLLTTKNIPQTTTSKSTQKTTYVNLDGTYTTTSTDWTTIDASAVIVDLENDYGKNATVYFSASLKIGNGSGQAYVRLYDDTNKIAVSNSELTSLNNISFTLHETGNLPIWKGRNTYKLQIKSLNSQEIYVTNAKMKIYY